MADIILCCGMVGSGKSTFARRLQATGRWVHFSADRFMLALFGAEPRDFDRKLGACAALIYDLSQGLLDDSFNVVLDFGFWSRADRFAVAGRFASRGHRPRLVYFPIAADEQARRIRERNGRAEAGCYSLDEAAVAALNARFEAPGADEDFVLGSAFVFPVVS